jgi:HSP20 family protein
MDFIETTEVSLMAREKTLARKERLDLEPFESWDTFRAMERMFKDFLTSPPSLLRPRSWLMPEIRHELTPEVDLRETENELILTASVPGLGKDDIDINATADHITVSGERKSEEEKPGETYHLRQQTYGSFGISFELPTEVKPEEVKATYKDGVLTVHMPKAEVTEEHKVKVEVED